jgi:hypothetical protein
MNERIKQITGQVLDEIVPYTWTTLGYDKIKQIQYRTAELIVRECGENFAKVWYEQGLDIRGAELDKFMKRFDEHFGVKE